MLPFVWRFIRLGRTPSDGRILSTSPAYKNHWVAVLKFTSLPPRIIMLSPKFLLWTLSSYALLGSVLAQDTSLEVVKATFEELNVRIPAHLSLNFAF
jgi:hypothetical protein